MSWVTPVTNRTQEDVDNAKEDRKTIQSGGALESYANLDKGSITHETLNRIEGNQAELKNLLNTAGYWGISATIRSTAWTENDILRAEDWQRILKNETALKRAYFVYQDTPQTPNETLDYINLNAVEKILADLKAMIASMQSYYRECNTFYCGE